VPTTSPKPLVLIVEDHPDTQSVVAEAFEENGYETVVAFDGDMGLAIVRERHPALVCLDLNLPRISGHDVCERIREDPSLQDVAILMMSAGRTPETHAHALEAGADMYLPNPFDTEALLAAAKELTAARKGRREAPEDELTDLELAGVAVS
jgi:DNA-binding response OmpR family regulator